MGFFDGWGGGGGSSSDDSNDDDDKNSGGGGGLFDGVRAAYDAAAGAADHAAGSVDEAVARSTDDESGGGVFDGAGDAFNTASDAAGTAFDTAAGAADHAAGNADEAVSRTFDDESGGGVFDGAGSAYDQAAGAADKWAGDADEKASFDDTGGFESTLDHALGSTDEAVSRSFDDESGGGVADGAINTADAATGASEWANSEGGKRLKRKYANADGPLSKADLATRAGLDFLLDNPRVSVQDFTRTGIEKASGSKNLGKDAQNLATAYKKATGNALDGTAADNPVTDAAVWLGEAVVADPAKAAITGLTGTDIDTGSNEGTVGAVDAFDIGLTVATGGAGKAGLSAARGALKGSDEAASLVDDVMGQGDNAKRLLDNALGGGGDDAAQAGQEAVTITDDAASTADDAASGADDVSSGLEAASVADDAAGVTDDSTTTASNIAQQAQKARSALLKRYGDDAASGADDTASVADDAASASDEAASVTDDAASTADDAASGADDVARWGDEAAQTGDGLLSRISPSTTTGKVATAGAGVLGAGALADQLGTFDRLRITDESGQQFLLVREKSLKPTENHPDGGTLWRVEAITMQGEKIVEQATQGYTVILSVVGRNVYILGGDGSRTKAKASAETFKKAVKRAQGNVGGGA